MALTAHSIRLQKGTRALLDGVDLSLDDGDCLALVGVNGAGKTTLLRALLGAVRVQGEVRLDGQALGAVAPTVKAARVGWLPQLLRLSEPVCAEEFVAGGRFRFGESRPMRVAAARRALAEVGVAHLAGRLVDTLSGGERQRVALASLVAQEAGLWLLDEPASHLDPGIQEAVYRFLADQWRGGRGVALVTHDPDLLLRVTTTEEAARVRLIGMQDGRVACEMRLGDEDLPERLGALYGVRMRWVDLGERRALCIVGAR